MSKPVQPTATSLRQRKILDALHNGARTWDELRAQTKVQEEGLGYALGELLDMRKIWTKAVGDVRVYGVERRKGLVPRFSHAPLRRDDLRA